MRDGVCSICSRPVLDGEGVHGLTGDHWDCLEPTREFMRQILDENREKFTGEIVCVRANGGSLLHLKFLGQDASLCGHEPVDTAWKMRRRGRWIRLRYDPDETPGQMRRCATCQDKYKAQNKSHVGLDTL